MIAVLTVFYSHSAVFSSAHFHYRDLCPTW